MNVTKIVKEKNIVSLYVEDKTKPYTVDINTGIVYGLRNTPIKQIKITEGNLPIEFRRKEDWFNKVFASIFDNWGQISNTCYFVDYLPAIQVAETLSNLKVPYVANLFNRNMLNKTKPYINDFIQLINRANNGEQINYRDWLEEIDYRTFLKENNFSKDIVSFEQYKEFCNHPILLKYFSHYQYCLERPQTIEKFQRITDYLYGWGYNGNQHHFNFISILTKYYECCETLNKKPEKTSNIMKEIEDTIHEYKLKQEEFDNEKIKANYEKHSIAFNFTYGDFTVVCPQSAKDIIDEGANMHHCVGGYVGDVVKNSTYIVFIRHKDTPDKCYITAQVDKRGRLDQYYLAWDRRISSSEDIAFKGAFAEHLRLTW